MSEIVEELRENRLISPDDAKFLNVNQPFLSFILVKDVVIRFIHLSICFVFVGI